MSAPVWEGIAAHHTLVNLPHMAVFILILLVTYIRPSELLALTKKDIAPPLVLLLPWLVGRDRRLRKSTKAGVRDGSVLIDQRWLQWVTKLLPAIKAGNPEDTILNFGYPSRARLFKTATDALGLSGLTMNQTRHSGASIGRVRGF